MRALKSWDLAAERNSLARPPWPGLALPARLHRVGTHQLGLAQQPRRSLLGTLEFDVLGSLGEQLRRQFDAGTGFGTENEAAEALSGSCCLIHSVVFPVPAADAP